MRKKVLIILIVIPVILIILEAINNFSKYIDKGKIEIAQTNETITSEEVNNNNNNISIENKNIITDEEITKEFEEVEKEKNNINANKDEKKINENINTSVKKDIVIEKQTEQKMNLETTNKDIISSNEKKIETSSLEDTNVKNKTERCTNVNNHFLDVGNSNKWFDTEEEAIAYYDAEQKKWGDLLRQDENFYKEYVQKCPYRI